MRQRLRVIIYNAQEDCSAAIRADLLSLDGVQIVAEVDEIALVEQAVKQFPAEILMVNLDPAPQTVLPVVADIAGTRSEPAVFVLSGSTDAQLILTAMRCGVREFLTKPLDRSLLAVATGRVASANVATRDIGQLISVFGTIGGVGASMLAANLAAELNDLAEKKPVALVDLDFRFGQLATMLDLQAEYTIADLCETPEQLDPAMIGKAMIRHPSGVHLLARPNQFSQADQITAAHCASVLSSLQQLYKYVVVDGPIRFDPGGSAVIDLADVSLFVIQLLVTSIRNTHRVFTELREHGYNLDRFQLVCNRIGQESGHLAGAHVEKTLNKKIAHRIPDDWKTASSAINVGVPLIELAPKSRVRLAIREIAESIAQPPAAQAVARNHGRGGLLGRIFTGAS
ncbi:MAG TPA: hypothetical protein VLM89_07535 [Phycisphaerae bacterium]|nr:hypothetical protein [Phycisphaerae bacterium]